MIQIPNFRTKEELFAHLKANKSLYISAKKSATKYADAVSVSPVPFTEDGNVQKAIETQSQNVDSFNVKVAINTTNLMDSHSDVHIPGLWNKSIKERKDLYLLKEHKMQFENVISDQVKATAETMTWKELGANYPGNTEVLVFNASITKEDNPDMAKAYLKGKVKNHSVGMQYVKIELAINSDSKFDAEEKAVWDKYISQVANKSDAEAQGYFWVVTEAKVIEGSAVLIGSNPITPVITTSENTKTLDTADPFTEPDPLQWNKVAEAIKSTFTKN